jgi:Ulp1 family protease
VYIFNSFFFENLSKDRKGINYEAVQKWTSKVDLFEYDYLVIPINKLFHWYGAIICNLPLLKQKIGTPTIIILDSLGYSHSRTIQNLQDYLVAEGKTKHSLSFQTSDITGIHAESIPKQDNYRDCGLYILGYIEKLLEDPHDLVKSFHQPEFDKEQWQDMNASKMRTDIRNIISLAN